MCDIRRSNILDALPEEDINFPALVPERPETPNVPAKSDDGVGVVRTNPLAWNQPIWPSDNLADYSSHQELPMDTPSESSDESHLDPKSAVMAHVVQRRESCSRVIKWTQDLAKVLDSVKSLPAADARLLETGKTKFPNLPIIRIGLRHTPCEVEKELRTITISTLPPNTSMDQVLRAIRGGEVLSAFMCNTVRVTGFLTALITFVTSIGAARFLSIAEQEGCYVGFQKVKVKLVGTPTYPMRRILQDRIVNRGRTRALTILSADRSIKKTVHSILSDSTVAAHIECFKEHRTPEEFTVLFYSVEMAMRAYKLLQGCPGIEKMWFGSDPCGKTPQNEVNHAR